MSIHHDRRRRQRGVTLIEMLVVVSIIALISAGVAVAAYRYYARAREKTAATNARAIRGAVKTWWLEHGKAACPTLDELVSDDVLDRDTSRVDPWGRSWRVTCSEGRVTVSSAGPDRRHDSDDDIRVPPV